MKTSHVLRAMGVSESLAKGAVRFSFSVDTTQKMETPRPAMHENRRVAQAVKYLRLP